MARTRILYLQFIETGWTEFSRSGFYYRAMLCIQPRSKLKGERWTSDLPPDLAAFSEVHGATALESP